MGDEEAAKGGAAVDAREILRCAQDDKREREWAARMRPREQRAMTAMTAVLYAEPLPDDLQEIVRAALPAGWTLDVVKSKERGELLRRVAEVDFLVVASTKVDAELL